MNRRARLRFGALIIFALTSLSAGGPAHSGSTATRCEAQACIHVHCNSTGDRCYRYEDTDADRRCVHCGKDDDHLAAGPDHGRLVCDSDGDRCYRSASSHWNYREYYRRQGYHWDDEGR
ncbi:MAG: hypothetical protein ACREHV_08060 [Rhizomicrobium sp.]